ncbi:hypothetical protein SLS55_002589 [Diplodia seriata]|uniref:Arginine metabolism regulation protein II n=1 Tax=Diplodia seriata TaxID=420778 RepID=A0ABR3CSM2_9PEZI
MCRELVDSTDLDYKSNFVQMEERAMAGEEAVIEGPFTVFRLDISPRPDEAFELQQETLPGLLEDPLVEVQPFEVDPEVQLLQDSEIVPSPPSPSSSTNKGSVRHSTSTFDPNAAIEDIQHDDFASLSFLFPPEGQDPFLDQLHHFPGMHDRDQDKTDFMHFSLSPVCPQALTIPASSNSPISAEEHLLLSHFMSDFVKVASPTSNGKSPWQTLYFPEALKTVGQLTLRADPSAASLSLLYSLMVISAFHLDRLSGAEAGAGYWWRIAESYQAKAMAHIQLSLRHEVVGPKKAKYKITNGKLVDARKHLLDAQRLIHVRGISKTNPSRKVQMLHAMFLYLRVMEEATFVYPISGQSEFFQNHLSPNEHPSSARYPSLAAHRWFSGSVEDGVPANFRELDDFFERSGPALRPLFARTYGVPESLVVLMSHITYLCCEVRQVRAQGGHPWAGFAEDYAKRCKVVEDLLCAWTINDQQQHHPPPPATSTCPSSSSSSSSSLSSSPPSPSSTTGDDNNNNEDHAASAFHASLVIFFYREVRDINRFTLQHLVKSVKSHLLALEGRKIAQGEAASASVLWPGFIAAVEALDHADFAELCAWMRGCAARYGLRSFDRAADVAADVWAARMQMERERGAGGGGASLAWPERVLQKKSFMILP